MEQRIADIAIAGLLHDVGKVLQRAQADPWLPPQGHSPEVQTVHAMWTEYFIDHSVYKVHRPAARPGVYHHQPDRSPAADHTISNLVALADKLSAGERADEMPEDTGSQLPRQMVSIFDRVCDYREQQNLTHHYLPLAELSLDSNAIFPGPVMDASAVAAAYSNLVEGLKQVCSQNIDDPETYLENLQAGLQRYTWCVPSAYYHSLPDVSLYDHSRMTAALAVCLAERPGSEVERLLAAVRATFAGKASPQDAELLAQPAALLIGGDISGIQKFLYTLSAKNAAKTLRGRSFYLQLLTEAVMRFVLHELGIPIVNVIYSGGGHFFLLAPLAAAEKLPAVRRKISEMILKHHGASLYFALGWSEVPFNGFKLGEFPRHWDQMHARLSAVKQHRYQEFGSDLYDRVFEPIAHGGNQEDTCSVCGEEKPGTSILKEQGEGEGTRICPLCKSFIESFGKYLPQTVCAAFTFGDPTPRDAKTAADVLAEFGMDVQLFDQNRQRLLPANGTLANPRRVTLWALQDKIQQPDTNGLPAALTLHYTVNQVPQMTFDELQDKANGISRLGVLRMDVDNLGNLFKKGFGEGDQSIATLARLSTLSAQISLFFDGWVKQICEQTSDLVYAVYSGGDDLFLIAPWDLVPGLAARIAGDFARYTSGNPGLHLSGGMAFIHGKYPVYQAAEDAGKALDSAKGREGKNAFSFLGGVWPWTKFSTLQQKFELLVTASRDHRAPAQLLQLLQQLSIMDAAERKQRGQQVMGRWLWLGDYQLKRMIERAKENPALTESLNQIRQDLKDELYGNIGEWGKAARWAQLYLREKPEKQ